MNEFYLTLPSNSSMDVYPTNTKTDFKTKLPNRIELDGKWEVGLVEIQYPHSWYNLAEGEEVVKLWYFPINTPVQELTLTIPPGYYNTIEDLLNRIEDEIQLVTNATRKPVLLRYDEITRKVTIDCFDIQVEFKEGLRRILGFEIIRIKDGKTLATQTVDMDPLHSIYVYCDLLESRIVGDKMTQLLRVVPVEGKSGDMVTRTYENVHYVSLQLKSFEDVEINIRDDSGNYVPFERGTLNVTLHFRRQRVL